MMNLINGKNHHGYSFRKRILLLVSISLFILSISISVITSWISSTQVKQILLVQAEELTRSLAQNSTVAFIYKNGDAMTEMVDTVMTDKSVRYIEFVDDRGELLFSKGERNTGLEHTKQYSGNSHVTDAGQYWLFSNKVYLQDTKRQDSNLENSMTDHFIDDAMHLVQEQSLLGYVNMTMNTSTLNSARNQIFFTNLSIAVVASLVLIVLLYFFIGRLFTPLEGLATKMTRIRQGDWVMADEVKSSVEIASINSAFNEMTNALQERDKALNELNKHLELMVEKRTKELEMKNQELRAFNYSVSHDLRAPLRSINGFSQILLEDYLAELSEEAQDYLQRIIGNVDRMSDLIDDMLKLSRITSQELMIEKVPLYPIISEIMDSHKFEKKGTKIDIDIERDLSVNADPGMVKIIMENLLGNAIKYTSKKDLPIIKIGTLSDKKNIFYIQDNGAGFDMKYSEKLFNPFQRLHNPAEFEGTGIGLALVKRIISRHHGRIWITSELDKGTTVYFSFEEQMGQSE